MLYMYIQIIYIHIWASQAEIVVRKPPANAENIRDVGLLPGSRRFSEEAWQPTSASLPGESYGQRSLAGYSPWGHKESDITKATYYSTQDTFVVV